jgi:lipoprotein-anchoring transpeptidase ErfK/SrfK
MPDSAEALTRRRMIGLAGAAAGVVLAPRLATAAQAIGEPMNLLPPGYIDIVDEPGRVPIPGEEQLPKHLQRTPVFFRTTYPVGSIVVDTSERYLYLSTGPQKALRYGVGVGKEGFQWDGLLKVSRKAEWPSWRPPPDMLKRKPELPKFMEGGPGNPLGARALYLGDTVYRIHGTNQPKSIGYAMSSGCFRMLNEHVIDLYGRVPVGTWVVVRK